MTKGSILARTDGEPASAADSAIFLEEENKRLLARVRALEKEKARFARRRIRAASFGASAGSRILLGP